nr:MAG TPA: hypothetical protein [Caudoviricetes sp.]DAY30154.1 MAG TPA: hypothetical protein [Caudoviricetes sp.]
MVEIHHLLNLQNTQQIIQIVLEVQYQWHLGGL